MDATRENPESSFSLTMKDILPIFSGVLSLFVLSDAHGVHHNHVRHAVPGDEHNSMVPSGMQTSTHPISQLPTYTSSHNVTSTSHTTATSLKTSIQTSLHTASTRNLESSIKSPSAKASATSKANSSSASKASSARPSATSKSSSTNNPTTATSKKASSTSSKTSFTSAVATDYFDYSGARLANSQNCQIFDPPDFKATSDQCYNACRTQIDEAKTEKRTTSYGCVAFTPLNEKMKWYKWPGGKCSCDNAFINELADTIIDALPAIAQIGCFIIMSSLRLVFEKALEAIPEVGTAVNAGMKALIYAANLVKHAYDASQAPGDAFDFWLSPCGGDDLVPQQLKDAFGILQQAGDVISFEPPKKIGKGSGEKGDAANPTR
ncbi:hypothetical protein CC80DRAFT_531556 [Byssothecium circinans]|uniref:Uncharacterized protein n=1 Tax=Byssothecium circinans TaxID=147558 RepID=A0A6A5UAJ3_9PLEO|nr:hypothetical protein CC80DRAFT_531556 [Byssothecium circinans]